MTGRGREYATALFELALEDRNAGEIAEGLSVVEKVLEETPESVDFFTSPAISREEKLEVAHRAFDGAVCDTVLSFFSLLCEKGRVSLFPDVKREYDAFFRESIRESIASVVSAAPLSDGEKEAMRVALEKKSGHTVIVEYRVDPALLGGVIVEMDGTRMDGSLRRRLRDIKETMEG